MNKEITIDYKAIADHCRKLGLGKIAPQNVTFGLCYEIRIIFNHIPISNLIDFSNYPEFSGNNLYPIKSLGYNEICIYTNVENLWIGEYGDNRKHFCLWVADEIERLIDLGEL